MINWNDEMIQAERRADKLRHAERQRLVRLATAPRRAFSWRLGRLLTGTGSRLVDWGCRLQARTGHLLRTSASNPDVMAGGVGRLANEAGSGTVPCNR